jgi:hypothetical protein
MEQLFTIDGIEIVVGIDDGELGPEVGIWDHETADKDLTDSYIDHPVVVAWLDEQFPESSPEWTQEDEDEFQWEARRNGDYSFI